LIITNPYEHVGKELISFISPDQTKTGERQPKIDMRKVREQRELCTLEKKE
jgi:hypothetical protein